MSRENDFDSSAYDSPNHPEQAAPAKPRSFENVELHLGPGRYDTRIKVNGEAMTDVVSFRLEATVNAPPQLHLVVRPRSVTIVGIAAVDKAEARKKPEPPPAPPATPTKLDRPVCKEHGKKHKFVPIFDSKKGHEIGLCACGAEWPDSKPLPKPDCSLHNGDHVFKPWGIYGEGGRCDCGAFER